MEILFGSPKSKDIVELTTPEGQKNETNIDTTAMDKIERSAYNQFIAGLRQFNSGNYIEAAKHFRRAVRLFPSQLAPWINLAVSLNELHRYSSARRAIEEAIRLDPDDGDCYFVLGNILRSQRRFREAVDAYKQVISLESTPPYDVLHNLGITLADLKEYPDAYNYLMRALELDPSDADTLYYAAAVEGKLGLRDRSIEHYFRAGELDPTLWNGIAGGLRDLKEYSAAAQAERNEIDLRPNNAWAYQNLGYILKDAGRYEQAIEEFRKAIEIDPDRLGAIYHMALCLKRLRNYTEAEKALTKALKIDPSSKTVQRALASIQKHLEKADQHRN